MCWYSVLLVLINMHGENNIKLLSSLTPYADAILGDHQYGF
jgi:hypothetical protein